MKDKFLSKAVPRGTRTIWRYLSALLILFTFAGNVWGAVTFAPENNPATKKYGDITFLDVANTKANGKITADGATFKGDSTLAYSLRYVGQTLAITTWYNCSDGSPASNFESSPTYEDAVVNGFVAPSSTSGNIGYGGAKAHGDRIRYFYATGITSVAIISHDNKDSKYVQLKIEEVAENGTLSAVTTIDSPNKSSSTLSLIEYTTALNPAKYYKISCTSNNTSNCKVYQIRFGKYIAPACDEANASIIANTSVYVNDELDLEFSSDNTNSVVYDIKKGGSATSDASVTAGVFQATVAGTYVVTATQAIDASGHCAVEESVTITVNPKTPVESVSVAGAAAGYKGTELTFTATAQYATAYEWYVDEVKQGSDSAKLLFTPSEAKTYSIVCKAKNAFNSDWVASSAHSLTVTSLYGELIRYVVDGGTAAKEKTGVLVDVATPEVSLTTGTTAKLVVDEVEYTGHKMDRGKYVGVKLTSGSFAIGDTVSFLITQATGSAKLYLYNTKEGTLRLDSINGSGQTGWVSFVLNQATTGVYLYRSNPDVKPYDQNPYVAAVSVKRPMPAKSVAYDLTAVKINGTAISAENLATLKTADAYLVDLMAGYAAAPVVKFARQTTTTYEDDSQKVANDTITVTASEVSSKWQAQATIGTITYTVNAAKQSSAKVYYCDGSTKLGEETVAINGNPINAGDYDDKTLASFVGWYNNADLEEEHKIANIAALVVTKDTTVYGKWTYTYATSANIEQWVLDNGKTPNSDKTGALRSLLGARGFASNLAYEEKKVELDSLNDDKGTGRNYTYLGLKVKSAGKLFDFRLAKDNTVKVKFGNVAATPKVSINGADYADMELTAGVYSYTATGNDYVSIKTASDGAVVFQQVMINEPIADVTLPEPTRHAVVLNKAGETEHGTLAVASPETYNWLAKDVEVTLTVAADEGYYIESVTLNGEALTPSENVYSFAMPNATANVVATFAEIVPNNVTYKANNGGEDADILAENATEIAGCSFTYAGHKFNGWNTEANGSGDAYAEGDAVLSPLTLYAQWKEYFVITYKDGDDVLDTEDVFVGEAPVGIADPVKAMNIFQGWTLAGSDEVIDVTTLDATTTVYAKWEAIDACFYFSAKSVAESTAIAVDEEIDNAYGGKVIAKTNNITYETLGVLVASSGSTYMKVELDYAMMEGTKISVKLAAGGTSTRGVNICYDANKDHKACPMTWSASASGEVKEFEYTLDSESALNGKKEFFIYRAANTYIQTVKVSNCAPQDYTVTYKDGESVLGTEQVFENEHPTADGINTHKKGYEFQGWAETVDGAVVDLDDITITAAKNLFAQYTVKDCSPKGVKFSMAVDGSKISANQYYPATTPAVGDLAVFATVTGGVAQAVNTSTGTTKNFEVKTTPEFRLGGNNSHMRILLDCPLAENDTIKFTKTERITLSFDSLKTKSENIAKNTSYYIVPAAYAGEDTIHIWYNSNGVSVNGVQVIRPEIYAVSFNLMGHGSAIAPVNVVKGAKIVAPTAPEDVDYAFAGWYKENTLSNEWDFNVDVVTANTTLYAKWIDLSDATLKSLKYGAEEIALQAGVYTYNVELPALTTAVPALTAETSNPGATKEITDATAFDAEGHATSTVVVTPEKEGAATQTYTVNFSKAADLPQVNVTESEVWDFSVAGSTSLTNQTDVVLANVPGIINDENFNSQALKGTFNKMEGTYFQGSKLNFTTEVDGLLTITFRGTNDKARHLQVCVGEGETIVADWNYQGSGESAQQTKSVYVPVGKVTLKAFEGEAAQNARIYKMELDATADYTRTVNPNNIGTLCWTNDAILGGATLYELAGKNENNYLVFDEVEENRLEAGKPYIFVPENGNTEIKVYNTSDEAVDGPINEGTGMVGTFTNLSTIDDENSPLWNKYIISNNHYVYVDYTNCRLGAYRAYITSLDDVAPMNTQEAPAPGRRRIVMGGQNQMPTGIDAINASEKPMKIMIDGQIYILRGQKMYDATGRLVK